jgi:hypothetical protein
MGRQQEQKIHICAEGRFFPTLVYGREMKSFSLVNVDARIRTLALKTEKEVLARWVIDCVERVLPLFEAKNPKDKRPRLALEALERWTKTGRLHVAMIQKATQDAREAADAVGEDSPARSAAQACAQAAAMAHVITHALGATMYALQAVGRNAPKDEVADALIKETEWQYARLLKLRTAS